jgi:hypothetical protein
MPNIDREELLELLADPEFQRELQRRALIKRYGAPLTRAEDYIQPEASESSGE